MITALGQFLYIRNEVKFRENGAGFANIAGVTGSFELIPVDIGKILQLKSIWRVLEMREPIEFSTFRVRKEI
jgi:hypothetical protein